MTSTICVFEIRDRSLYFTWLSITYDILYLITMYPQSCMVSTVCGIICWSSEHTIIYDIHDLCVLSHVWYPLSEELDKIWIKIDIDFDLYI